MKQAPLATKVATHSGRFLCEQIRAREQTKTVEFHHAIEPPKDVDVPDIGRLRDFYDTFGSVTFYVDPESGEAAKRIAPPGEWDELETALYLWFEGMGDDEREEYLPDWIDSCLVIGEEPRTGNYLLMPTSGEDVGKVFLFDHDGCEFPELAGDVIEYVEKLLEPDNRLLVEIATHMRFIVGDPNVQWWIRDMHDNRGNTATTSADV